MSGGSHLKGKDATNWSHLGQGGGWVLKVREWQSRGKKPGEYYLLGLQARDGPVTRYGAEQTLSGVGGKRPGREDVGNASGGA